VCYADFESSNKVVDGKTIQVPNSYVILSPDLLLLRDTRLKLSSYLKSLWSDDPELLMRHFISDLNDLHTSHMFRFDCNRKVPELTDDKWQRYNSTKKCENCGLEFGTRRPDGAQVNKVRHHDHVTNKYVVLGVACVT
jgi:hypothetical protein